MGRTRARRGLAVQDLPWLDSSWGDHAGMLATLKKQREAGKRRVIKSHLPAEALPLDHKARYIFIARCVACSAWVVCINHETPNP